MTIDKAIKILETEVRVAEVNDRPYEVYALQLGIEALKLIAQEPPEGYTCIPRPLPGETEE